MRISDWSSDVCSSDLGEGGRGTEVVNARRSGGQGPDLAQARARLARGNLEVVVGLEAHPELGRLPEGTPETQGQVGRHPSRLAPDVRDAPRRAARSAEAPVGKEGCRQCRTSCAPYP